MMLSYLKLIRFDKPIGSILLLWPTLCGLWAASQGLPPLSLLAIFITGVFLMRSAGCIVNDCADRNLDKHVERTKTRPLAIGALTLKQAFLFLTVLLALALLLVQFTNALTLMLACVGVGMVALYPFMKRIFYVPQAFLGLTYAWCVPMGYAARTNSLPVEMWWLYFAMVCWVIAFDSAYALADLKDDLQINIYSSARFFSNYLKSFIALMQILTIVCLWRFGSLLELGIIYNVGLVLLSCDFVYQLYRLNYEHPKSGTLVFYHNQYWGAGLFLIFLVVFGAHA